MYKFFSLFSCTMLLVGCSASGHYGKTSDDNGIESHCAGGCLVYKDDGSGCETFQKGTSESCANYFAKICESSPASCKN